MQNALAQLELELAPGERVLWSSTPKQGIRFSAVDIFAIPFALLWLAISIAFELMVLRTHAPEKSDSMKVILFLFGLPFILVGLYLLVGRHFADARKRARTVYGITNRRILQITGGPKRVRAFDLKEISDVNLIEGRDQAGKIRIHLPGAPIIIKAGRTGGREQHHPAPGGYVFDAVPRVRQAYDTLIHARAEVNRLPSAS